MHFMLQRPLVEMILLNGYVIIDMRGSINTSQCMQLTSIGYTALHYAALNGHISTIKLLKELGLGYIYNPQSNPHPFLKHVVTLYKFGKEFKFGQFIKELQISIEALKQPTNI